MRMHLLSVDPVSINLRSQSRATLLTNVDSFLPSVLIKNPSAPSQAFQHTSCTRIVVFILQQWPSKNSGCANGCVLMRLTWRINDRQAKERDTARYSERERKDLGRSSQRQQTYADPSHNRDTACPLLVSSITIKSKINLQGQDQLASSITPTILLPHLHPASTQSMSMASSRGSQHQKKGSSFTMAVKKKVKIIDRPLNSYNLYFILERALFLQSKGAKSWKEEDRRLSLNFHEYCDLELPPFPMRYQSVCVTF